MLRILIFLLSAIFVAGVVTVLAGANGRITAEAFGLRYEIHTGFAAGALFVAFAVGLYLMSVFKDLRRLPGDIRRREAEARRERGVQALTRGLEAVAVGDADNAQHHARVARRNLDESALTRLLTAQAAHLAGDEGAAHDNFTLMLDAPETEFLGLKGLYLHAMRTGDIAAARIHAERAFRLRPNARWAFESVMSLGLDRGAWGETREAVAVALKHKIIEPANARRAEAALLTADAHAAADSGDSAQALGEAEAALNLEPAFAPAAVLAARLHEKAGRRSRAARILEQAFADAAHPALIHAHNRLFLDDSAEKRAECMKRIADRRPTAREAKLQQARRLLLLGEAKEAVALLEPLLRETATASDCAMMAEAAAAAHGAEAAHVWLRRAANAPRDPTPGADGSFQFTRDGWARLVREYADHDRLAPPPLEATPPGLSEEELKRLTGPATADSLPPRGAISGAESVPDDRALPDENVDQPESQGARAVSAAGKVN